jgi:hypothetical protein
MREQSPSLPLPSPKLEPHYRTLVKAIVDGRVVPFLGSGVNLVSNRGQWVAGRDLPSSLEFAQYLAGEFSYPAHQSDLRDIPRITQYVAVMVGRGALREELRRIFLAPSPPTPLHRFFADLPALLRRMNSPARGLLILTSNYDDVLERAFKEAGEPFDLVTYMADSEPRGLFVHTPPGGAEPRPIMRPNEYRGLMAGDRTVILKVSGGIDRDNADRDSFVITEDDYLEQLARTDISSSVPVSLAVKLRRSHFLFLGSSLGDWNVRVILRRIWEGEANVYKSWAIQWQPDRIEQELWLRRGVDILNTSLPDYVEGLSQHIKSLISEVTT